MKARSNLSQLKEEVKIRLLLQIPSQSHMSYVTICKSTEVQT